MMKPLILKTYKLKRLSTKTNPQTCKEAIEKKNLIIKNTIKIHIILRGETQCVQYSKITM